MTISAPPRRPIRDDQVPAGPHLEDDHDPSVAAEVIDVQPLIEDGVIADAKRRVRRRRVTYAIAAGAFAVALGALSFAISGGPAAQTEAPAPAHRFPAVAPATGDPGEIVGAWRLIHVGWVFVYGDGRVLEYPDTAVTVDDDGARLNGIIERRLSQYGVDLVRSHVLEPRTLLVEIPGLEALWVDPQPREFQPQDYAVCAPVDGVPPRPVARLDTVVQRFPGRVQSILQTGRHQRFSETGTPIEGAAEPGQGADCIVLTPVATEALLANSDPGLGLIDGAPEPPMYPNDARDTRVTTTDGHVVQMSIQPLLPDGAWVPWGG